MYVCCGHGQVSTQSEEYRGVSGVSVIVGLIRANKEKYPLQAAAADVLTAACTSTRNGINDHVCYSCP